MSLKTCINSYLYVFVDISESILKAYQHFFLFKIAACQAMLNCNPQAHSSRSLHSSHRHEARTIKQCQLSLMLSQFVRSDRETGWHFHQEWVFIMSRSRRMSSTQTLQLNSNNNNKKSFLSLRGAALILHRQYLGEKIDLRMNAAS